MSSCCYYIEKEYRKLEVENYIMNVEHKYMNLRILNSVKKEMNWLNIGVLDIT